MKLYDYQRRIYDLVMQGKSVILQAPTGAGKTHAALIPYFETLERAAQGKSNDLPLTCRYAVPMRVLATQFQREYTDYFVKLDGRGDTEYQRIYHDTLGFDVPAIQTGELPQDPQFEAPLTFCTIDQLLASFIGTPYSLSSRRANINVAAVAGSYLVLDEYHLYPLEGTCNGARATTLAMLQLLQGFSPFVLMTATFSTRLLNQLAKLLDAEVVRVETEEELAAIMDGRRRTLQLAHEPLTAEAIMLAHTQARTAAAGASLVVCNTVARAQDIYLKLHKALEKDGLLDRFEIELLHSRFTPADRKAKSDHIEALLGKAQWRDGQFLGEKEVIVIGTQAVEVGLNISVSVLHSEIAPANSIIQRAGRCARFRQQAGTVIVYPLPPNADGSAASPLPYSGKLCSDTSAAIAARFAANGDQPVPFDFFAEQSLIDEVHEAEDQAMLVAYQSAEPQIKEDIQRVLATHDRSQTAQLIRNVDQVQVVIHPDPNGAMKQHIFRWESFGMAPTSLMGKKWQALLARSVDLPWTMLQPLGDMTENGTDEADSRSVATYHWDRITSDKQIPLALRIALPPELGTYDATLGFRLLLDDAISPNTYQSKLIPRTSPEQEGGEQSSYFQHVTGLLAAYRFSLRQEGQGLAAKIERELQLPAGSVDHAIRWALACHDIGKLTDGWQAWAKERQDVMVRDPAYGAAYAAHHRWMAKTDRLADWRENQRLDKLCQHPRPPHHACEGVMASMEMVMRQLATYCGDRQNASVKVLAQAVNNAIARHHTTLAKEYQHASWSPDARTAIGEVFACYGLAFDATLLPLKPLAPKPGDKDLKEVWLGERKLYTAPDRAATWLTFLVVRMLRLCDQRAERDL